MIGQPGKKIYPKDTMTAEERLESVYNHGYYTEQQAAQVQVPLPKAT